MIMTIEELELKIRAINSVIRDSESWTEIKKLKDERKILVNELSFRYENSTEDHVLDFTKEDL
jgi:hypothetical protein